MTSPANPVTQSKVVERGRIFGLDVMRSVAILCVVFAHGLFSENLHNLVNHVFTFLRPVESLCNFTWHLGLLGVEIFFVLSGFLIGSILIRSVSPEADGSTRGIDLLIFYGRRWFRTLPLFWLFIILNVILEYYLRANRLSLSIILGEALFLKNIREIHVDFMPESWSLAVEEWFYVIFPALLWAGYFFWPRKRATVFFVTALLLFSASLAFRIQAAFLPGANFVTEMRCAVLYRFDALMTGVFAAWVSQIYPNFWKSKALLLALIGVALLALGYGGIYTWSNTGLTIGPDNFYAKTFRFNVISLGVAFLLPAASLWSVDKETRFSGLVRKVALYSYALYLVNWPLFQIFMTPHFSDWNSVWWEALILFMVKQVLAFYVASLFYRFYESRITRIRENLPRWLKLA
jgi:peptidoglycan/LPS O-acetylase OafA/YrhL